MTPQLGKKAPEFEALNQDGEPIRLVDFKGKKVALYFYPKDMTPGCTVQAQNLNANLEEITSKDIVVIGVSADDEKRHCKFRDKYGLKFSLIADTEKKVIEAYGVWAKKKFMGKEYMGIVRKTFLINEEGILVSVIDKVKTKNHSAQILEAFENN